MRRDWLRFYIVREGHIGVEHESQDLFPEVAEADEEVVPGSHWQSAPCTRFARERRLLFVEGKSIGDDGVVATHDLSPLLLRSSAGFGLVRGPSVADADDL